jgi:pyridoxal phosphate enzyme (YggS family)
MAESINDKIQKLNDKIANITAGIGISSDNVHLIAVSKKQSVSNIIEAQDAGIKYFGENKVQEFVEKYDSPEIKADWHFVGHLQTNKVKYIINKVKLIHSVDSVHLAEKISQLSNKKGFITEFLLQVNTSQEESKFGFGENKLIEDLNKISQLKNIRVKGLMTMAPFTEKMNLISKSFASLKKLFDKINELKLAHIQMQYLSMGMSSDYEIAIKEGSNMLRIGTSIFGPRN